MYLNRSIAPTSSHHWPSYKLYNTISNPELASSISPAMLVLKPMKVGAATAQAKPLLNNSHTSSQLKTRRGVSIGLTQVICEHRCTKKLFQGKIFLIGHCQKQACP